MRKSRKATVIIGSTVGALAIGGVAFAYWTTSGSGSGTGATTSGVSDHVGFAQYALSEMYPGDSKQTLKVTVSNDSGESAYIAGVKAYITTNNPGCDGSNFTISNADDSASSSTAVDAASAFSLTWTAADLAAHATADATGKIQFNNKLTGQDVCKGAAVTIHYLAS